jgi:hypothetical protein
MRILLHSLWLWCLLNLPVSAVGISESCAALRRQFSGNISDPFPVAHPLKPLRFLHIPKNAGTTISRLYEDPGTPTHHLFVKNANFRTQGYARPQIKSILNEVPPRYWPSPNAYENSSVFCVVRHPVDKALSKFKMMFGKAKRVHNLTIVEEAHLWLKNVASDYLRWFCFDSHMIPQYQFIWDTKGVRTCHHTLRFENVVQDYNELMITYNKSSDKILTDDNSKSFRKHGDTMNSLSLRNISSETIRLVEKAYWMDMCLLGYDTEAEGPITYDDFSQFKGLNLSMNYMGFCFTKNHTSKSLYL